MKIKAEKLKYHQKKFGHDKTWLCRDTVFFHVSDHFLRLDLDLYIASILPIRNFEILKFLPQNLAFFSAFVGFFLYNFVDLKNV